MVEDLVLSQMKLEVQVRAEDQVYIRDILIDQVYINKIIRCLKEVLFIKGLHQDQEVAEETQPLQGRDLLLHQQDLVLLAEVAQGQSLRVEAVGVCLHLEDQVVLLVGLPDHQDLQDRAVREVVRDLAQDQEVLEAAQEAHQGLVQEVVALEVHQEGDQGN